MSKPSLPLSIVVYSRPGCHLCDEARTVIDRYRDRYPIELRSIDIERSAELESRYGYDIPVIFLNGEEIFRHRVDGEELERKLKALWNK